MKKPKRPIKRKVHGFTLTRAARPKRKPARGKAAAEKSTAPKPKAPAAAGYKPKQNGAFVIVLDGEDRFLVGEMVYKGGLLTLPGGGVERGEPYDVAAAIELHEEANDFRPAGDLRLVAAMPQRIPSDPHTEGTLILYECRARPGQTYRSRDNELANLRFMSLDEALGQPEKFHLPMLRLVYLAHACRHSKNSPGHFSANMTSPVWARKRDGSFVCI